MIRRTTTFWAIAWWIPLAVPGIAPAAASDAQATTATAQAEAVRPRDPLVVLNDASRAAYRRGKEAALARLGPLILVEGDYLVLKNGDQRIEARFSPDLFHILKTYSHIPLALDVMLATVPDGGRLDAVLLEELRQYRGLVESARERLTRPGLEPAQSERQALIIAASLGVIDSVIEARACTPNVRIAFTRRMSPLVLANAADASHAQLSRTTEVF
jgi:hypothetical protein